MDITIILIGILTFFVSILFIKGVYVSLDSAGKQESRRRLDTISGKAITEEISIIRSRALSYVPWLNKFLSGAQRFKNIDEIIKKAGISRPLGFFVLLSFFLGSLGFFGGWVIGKKLILGILGAGLLGISPFWYIFYKKNKRMQLFQKQLPDVLDLLSQSLRAGHSFPSGIKMVGDEFPEPIGGEFKAVSAEIYYGLSLSDALKNLTKRVDSEDLDFFITAAIIQRETGGNLAEMMNNIAHVIRERFKLFAKVKSLAAEGILSAWIVSLAPFVAGVGLYLINPESILMLFNDPVGKKMVIGAFIWLCVGILIIQKIVRIKV
jgi:tight adherence protein B